MSRPRKSSAEPKQPPPIAFRPPPELTAMLADFASAHGVGVHEAAKALTTLALNGLDARYYPLIALLATDYPGPNGFVRAAMSARTAAQAAARFAPNLDREPYRTDFLTDFVRDSLGPRSDPLLIQTLSLLRECLNRGSTPTSNAAPSGQAEAKSRTRAKRVRRGGVTKKGGQKTVEVNAE